MPALEVAIPIGGRPLDQQRIGRLHVMCHSLTASLRRVPPSYRVRIKLLSNGTRLEDRLRETLDALAQQLQTTESAPQVVVHHREHPGKISAVNLALADLTADALMVLDDDIVVPPAILPEAARFIDKGPLAISAYCFRKIALPAGKGDSGFTRAMAFLYHPASLQALTATHRFAPRPTGSAYVLRKGHLLAWPDPCNEAEFLVSMPHILSSTVVATWMPDTPESEARRRLTQLRARSGAPAPPPVDKSLPWLTPWEDFEHLLPSWLPPHLAERLRHAYEWQRSLSPAALPSPESIRREA